MSNKRRDNKGRVLRTGESQRKDGLYEYRYTDANKKRHSIYDSDLMRLRKRGRMKSRKCAMKVLIMPEERLQ